MYVPLRPLSCFTMCASQNQAITTTSMCVYLCRSIFCCVFIYQAPSGVSTVRHPLACVYMLRLPGVFLYTKAPSGVSTVQHPLVCVYVLRLPGVCLYTKAPTSVSRTASSDVCLFSEASFDVSIVCHPGVCLCTETIPAVFLFSR